MKPELKKGQLVKFKNGFKFYEVLEVNPDKIKIFYFGWVDARVFYPVSERELYDKITNLGAQINFLKTHLNKS